MSTSFVSFTYSVTNVPFDINHPHSS